MANISADSLWQAWFRSQTTIPAAQQNNDQVWLFCGNKADTDELAQLVITGTKRATAGALASYNHENITPPKPGDYNIITNWSGIAQCIMRTTRVTIAPFNQVDADFAAREGDGSLEYWYRTHKNFFKRKFKEYGLAFNKQILIVCQEFERLYANLGDAA